MATMVEFAQRILTKRPTVARISETPIGLALAPWGALPWAIYVLAATAWLTVVQRVLYVRRQLREGSAAVAHLFGMTCGLDSAVRGEAQIAGQVLAAYDAARAQGPVHPLLARVLERALAVARDRLSRPAKLMSSLAMAAAIKDKTAAEELLRASDLDWTIGHSVRLTNGPSIGAAKALPDGARLGLGDTVARADVAAWLLAAATDQFRGSRTVAIAA